MTEPQTFRSAGDRMRYMGIDGLRWAQVFHTMLAVDPGLIDDAEPGGWLHGWFANAIEAGRSDGHRAPDTPPRRESPQPDDSEDESPTCEHRYVLLSHQPDVSWIRQCVVCLKVDGRGGGEAQILGYSVSSKHPDGGHIDAGGVHATPGLAQDERAFLEEHDPGPVYRVVEIRAWDPEATA